MAILVPSWRLGGAPVNADPAWSQTCGFWRTSTMVCPDKLRVYSSGFGSSACFSLGRCMRFAVSGGWWTGYIGRDCAGSDTYITHSTIYDGNVDIDCWRALADGVWSSSFSFDVWAGITNFSVSRDLLVKPVAAASPSVLSKTFSPVVITAGDCASTGANVATVTVYDDGTLSLT